MKGLGLRRRPVARTFALVLLAGAVAGCIGSADDAFPGPGASPEGPGHAHPGTATAGAVNLSTAHLDALLPIDFDPLVEPGIVHTPPFPLEDGKLPTRDEAREFANAYRSFHALGNEGLETLRSEGHLAGNGTPEEPYVLERFYVSGDLTLASADKALIVREGWVEGQLTFNYVGPLLYVHDVYASDLRVNENVERNGTNTGGLFENNKFAFVGQIRHFTGEFRDNEVGPRPRSAIQEVFADTGIIRVKEPVVFNFDGFHGADVHDNVFVGEVDVKLHGHNHGDCFVCPVHDHSDEAEFPGTGPEGYTDPTLQELGFRTRHSVRYDSLLFRDNEIRVEKGVALRYNDRNHAGDDQTANSEPNEFLEDPHVHWQDVTVRGNRLVGGSFHLDIFNAEDENHAAQNRGILRLLENDVTARYEEGGDEIVPAMLLDEGDGIELVVRGNTIRFEALEEDAVSTVFSTFEDSSQLVGFFLARMSAGNVTIQENVVEQGTYGVFASDLAEDLWWRLVANDFHTTHDWQGRSVGNPPEES